MNIVNIVKHKYFLLGVIILLVLVCAIVVLQNGAWLDSVHQRYMTPAVAKEAFVCETSIDKTFTIKGNDPVDPMDIRYPDAADVLTFTFKTDVDTVKLISMATRKVITSTSGTDKKVHELYSAEPGEYEMQVVFSCDTDVKYTYRIKISPVFNFAGRDNTYFRLPVTGWSNSANLQLLTSSDSVDPITVDQITDLTLNMIQFNTVKLRVKIPNFAEYKNKLTEIGFGSQQTKASYEDRIKQLEAYLPIKFEGTLEQLGNEDGTPVSKTNFPNPRLIFPVIGCTDTKMCCVSTGDCYILIRNVRKNQKYRLTMYLKYQRPDSSGYRTTQVKQLTIIVRDLSNTNDLSAPGSKIIDVTDDIANRARLQLKFEKDQGRQDTNLLTLENTQNKVFDNIARF